MTSHDTIAAIATAPGSGGIGIIRVSGPLALPILQKTFSRKLEFTPRRLEYGWALDAAGSPLDEVLAVFMPGPRTFSGEDTAEIHCHGGAAVLEAVLGAVFSLGARPAGPGEFTRRAFLNGRLDLSQAEAVAEMIAAPTLQGVHLARNKLAGRLSARLDALRQDLDWLRARLYLAIDFPDEAEEEAEAGHSLNPAFQERAGRLIASLDELLLAYERAGIWRQGALAALAGRVNVGKSSLLNALLGRRRALVSDRPGTTRDFIEESLNLGGLPLRLTDTAGLRLSDDQLETEGMELARDVFNQASVILLLLEAPQVLGLLREREFTAEDLSDEEREILDLYGPAAPQNKVFIVLNKSDLATGANPPDVLLGCPCRAVSARAGLGLDQLAASVREFILRRSGGGEPDFSDQAAPGQRQALLLRDMRAELTALRDEYAGNIPADLLGVRLDTAAAQLAELAGHSCAEDILDQVFSSFCIGK